MTLEDAIAIVHEHAHRALPREALVVHANGMISRAGFTHADRAEHFYMIGSMGLASSIGLGVALARPNRRVVVCDGDGNVLMNLGTLALIGARRPPNLLHVCLDNGVYGSTGNQRTLSGDVPLERVARAAGYAATVRVDDRAALTAALENVSERPGPAFLLVRITPDLPDPVFRRVSIDPAAMTERFRGAAAGE
jgi:thiamine pyrophosphate-dependent acetolactate synthase large subunit-like protein